MAKIIIDPDLELKLLGFPLVMAATRKQADEIIKIAKRIAPVATGTYRESIHREGAAGRRDILGRFVEAGAIVVADVPYAGFLEFGTWDTPTFATLRKAAAMAGLSRTRGLGR